MSHIHIETKYWTTQMVLRYFAVSVQTLGRWREETLPHVVIEGNRKPILLYEPKKIHAWAIERKVKTYARRAFTARKEVTAA